MPQEETTGVRSAWRYQEEGIRALPKGEGPQLDNPDIHNRLETGTDVMFIFETSKGAKESIHHAIYHDISNQQRHHLNKLNLDKIQQRLTSGKRCRR